MPKTLSQINATIAALQKEAAKARATEITGVVGRIKEAIATYGLSAADLGFEAPSAKLARAGKTAGAKRGPKPGAKSAKSAKTPKFGDGTNVWSGRGPRPQWFKAALTAGKKPEELLFKSQD